MPAAETVGDRIRRIRKARGMTQAELAEKAGMHRTDVNRAERGSLQLGAARLARVAAALEVSVLELRPEAEPDELGLMFLERQTVLEAEVLLLVGNTSGLAARVEALAAGLEALAARVAALERRARPESPEEETGG